MSRAPVDPQWPQVLSLAVHELRSPVTVITGYIRMLLQDAAGPLADQQRSLLEATEKSSARLAGLLKELTDLASLESGSATFNRASVDLPALLSEVVAHLPPAEGQPIGIRLELVEGPATVHADPVRLRSALTAVLLAVRRELAAGDTLVIRETRVATDARAASWLLIGESVRVGELPAADESALATFDEWRGGCGLSLTVARRVIELSGGRIWSPRDRPKSGAVLELLHA